jgi:hypothetical protein
MPIKICFPFIAQVHQAFHALPIALETALRHRDAEVHLAAATPAQLSNLKRLADTYAPNAPVIVDKLRIPWFFRRKASRDGVAAKTPTLLLNARYFAGFDALVVPERTSLILKKLLRRTRMIWTRHGAGDRASGFEDEIREFDFVLMAGGKIEQRLREQKLIREGHYATGIYAKFDLVERLPHPPLFANSRPTILYNPHFKPDLSSWPIWGRQVLDHRPELPEFVVGVALPIDVVGVQEHARARPAQEFSDLATDIAEIKVRAARVGHVGRSDAAKVDPHARAFRIRIEGRIFVRGRRVEQPDVRGEHQVIVRVRGKMVENLTTPYWPG